MAPMKKLLAKQYLNLNFLLKRAFVTIMHMYGTLLGIKGLQEGIYCPVLDPFQGNSHFYRP